MEKAARFHWADYAVFAASLVLSASIGIYFGVAGKRQNTIEEFLMAGRGMNPIPVAVSLFVSWMSAISFLGDPVEAYTFGAVYWIIGLGYVLSLPLVGYLFAPFFHKMNIISAYELLEKKYNYGLRLFATFTNILLLLLWLGIVLYAPALALSQSSGMPVWVALVTIGVVCIFYTALGGMKAVLWTDTIQMFIMLAGQMGIIIQGFIRLGGISNLAAIISETGHNKFTNLDPSPFARATIWTFLIGGFFRTLIPHISSQMMIQRYCTVKTPKQASLSVYLNIPIYLIMVSIFTAIGLVMAGLYAGCDPVMQGKITHRDQMVPLMVIELLGFLPGIPGLFMACIFSASLSSLSSGINSMAANTLKDFIEPAFKSVTKRNIPDRTATLIAKMLVIVYGVIIMGMAFAMMATGGSIFALCSKAVGMVGGPLGGVFFVGIIFPSIGSRSVIPSFVISFIVCLCIGIGAFFVPLHTPAEALPLSVDMCNITYIIPEGTANLTDIATIATVVLPNSTNHLTEFHEMKSLGLFNLNPLYYGPFGCITTILLSLIFHTVSVFITRSCKHGDQYTAVKTEQIMVVDLPYRVKTYKEEKEVGVLHQK